MVYVTAQGELVHSILKFESGRKPAGASVLVERLCDASRGNPRGESPASTHVNYFIGQDQNRWLRDAPVFHWVSMGEVYPGVEMRVRAYGNNVEKFFVVQPGASPDVIRVAVEGADELSVDATGELCVDTPFGVVQFGAPIAYQEKEGRKAPVSVAYKVEGDTYRFQVGAHDAALPVIIDPLMASTFLGGGGSDYGAAIGVDSNGNVFVAGYTTSSTNFPTTTLGFDRTFNGGTYDVFVSKFDGDMTNLLASTFLGGGGDDVALAMSVSGGGEVYLAGYSESLDFPVTFLAYSFTNNGAQDGFVTRLNSTLSAINASTYIGGEFNDVLQAIAVQNNGNICVGGYTDSTNFPVASSFCLTNNGGRDGIVARFDSDMILQSSAFLGGIGDDTVYGMALSGGTSVVAVGTTASANFPVNNVYAASYDVALGGGSDAFLTKMSPTLSAILCSTYMGGGNAEIGYSVAVDGIANGNIYFGGSTFSGDFPVNASSYRQIYGGNGDGCAAVFDYRLVTLQGSTYMGDAYEDVVRSIFLQPTLTATNPLVVLSGYTESPGFPTTANVYDRIPNGGKDGFVSKFYRIFTNVIASTFIGGSGDDQLMGLAGNSNYLYVAGFSASQDYPLTDYAVGPRYSGGAADVVVSKFPVSMVYGGLKWKVDAPGVVNSPAIGMDGNIYFIASNLNLCSLSPNGTTNWIYPQFPTAPYAGSMYQMGPVLDTNGTIYVALGSTLYAINPDGTEKWAFLAGGTIKAQPTIAADGSIVVASSPNWIKTVNAANGTLTTITTGTNAFPTGGETLSAMAVTTNGLICAGALGGNNVYVLNPDLTLNRTFAITNTYSGPSLDQDGNLYIGIGTVGCLLYSLNIANGTTNWFSPDAGLPPYTASAVGSNGLIYVGTSAGVKSFMTNGTTNAAWTIDGANGSVPLIAENGMVYIGGQTSLYAYSAAGAVVWKYSFGPNAVGPCSPVVDRQGTVYIGAGNSLYAIYGASPISTGPWPMYSHDMLHSGNAGYSTAPSAPTNVAASDGAFVSSIQISWAPVTNVSLYEIWRNSSNNTQTASNILTISATSYLDELVERGLVYYYWVKAKGAFGTSGFSLMDTGGTLPPPPATISASDSTFTNKIQVTWAASVGAINYELWRATINSNNLVDYVVSGIVGTSFDDANIVTGARYYYWIRAQNIYGTSDTSLSDPGSTPPGIPLLLTASDGASPDYIRVNWVSPTNAATFQVWRSSTNVSAGATNIASVSTTNYYDTGSATLTYSFYWVQANNDYGQSALSAFDWGLRTLAAPTNVGASDGAYSNKIHVSWTGPAEATDYEVWRATNANTALATRLTGLSETDYDDTAVTRGLTYYYWVKAKNPRGESDYSQPDTGGTPPLAPGGVSASDGTFTDSIRVSWNAANTATGYEVWRNGTIDSSVATLLTTALETNLIDVTAEIGTRYYYWVKASNPYGISGLSGSDFGWRALEPPVGVSATDGASTNYVRITWNLTTAATTYEVWRSADGESAASSRLTYLSSNRFDDVSAAAGTLYYYWVKAKNATFSSAFSEADTGYKAAGNADVSVSDMVFLPVWTAPGRHPEAISVSLGNQGPNKLEYPNTHVALDFYLSTDSTFGDTNDIWMGGKVTDVNLDVGGAARVTLTSAERSEVTIPPLNGGVYYAMARVQHLWPSSWADPDAGNNVTVGGTQVHVDESSPVVFGSANDFDADGRSDLAVYREATGEWYVRGVNGAALALGTVWGGPGMTPMVGDYDNDGQADLTVYSQTTGRWYIQDFNGSILLWGESWGGPGLLPVRGDFNGDGAADMAVFDQNTGNWYIRSVEGTLIAWDDNWGGAGFAPVYGDYDGDGKADLAVSETNTWNWYIRTVGGSVLAWANNWGGRAGFIAIPGDYDGDGMFDMAVYHQPSGYWFIKRLDGTLLAWGLNWGGAGLVPVPADYSGDGKTDLAVYEETTGSWFIRSLDGSIILWGVQWGGAGFFPVGGGQSL
ncbi:MAG: VCBS repeat-containing protein [Lentisphaerae bacterium]|nr:VCBS repeat-containing protein [Lentisphaerota bacterium]